MELGSVNAGAGDALKALPGFKGLIDYGMGIKPHSV